MSLIKKLGVGLFAVWLPLKADALTIHFQDLLNPANTLTVNDDDALDTGVPNPYLGRTYHSQIFMSPFSFGGFDFSRMFVQGDGFSWIGDNESEEQDNSRDQLEARLALAGSGNIQVTITDQMDNELFPNDRRELDTFVGHGLNLGTTLDVSVATYRGSSAFDASELLQNSSLTDFSLDYGYGPARVFGLPLQNTLFQHDRPSGAYASYWATHIFTIEGSGSISAGARLRSNLSEVPLPLSAAALFGAIGLLGGLKLRRRRT